MRTRIALAAALIACLGGLGVLPRSTSARDLAGPLRVPQVGQKFPVRPATLRFAYQPPGSYGDDETSGRPLYPPFSLTGLAHWQSWHVRGGAPGRRAEAAAAGTLHYDSCDPNCPQGRYLTVHARVKLTGEFLCERGGNVFATFERVTVTPAGGPARTRFIQCTGHLRSGARSDVIPAGVGFNRLPREGPPIRAG
jgi:hypothetical protein